MTLASSRIKLNDTAEFMVKWDNGTDVVLALDFGDGDTYEWKWLENNHTEHFLSKNVTVKHPFHKANNFSIALLAQNDVGRNDKAINLMVEPPLDEYLSIVADYVPDLPPLQVNFTIAMINGDQSEMLWSDCVVSVSGNVLRNATVEVSAQTPGIVTHIFNDSAADLQATVLCKNAFSSQSLVSLIILQQNITGLKASTSDTGCSSTASPVNITLTMLTGSDATFLVDFKESTPIKTYVHPNQRSNVEDFVLTRTYTSDGIFPIGIKASNKHTSEDTELALCMQHPVTELKLTGPANAVYLQAASFAVKPSLLVDLPTNVTCIFNVSMSLSLPMLAPSLSQGVAFQYMHTYDSILDVGDILVRVNCMNKVSTQILTHNLTLYEDIVGLTALTDHNFTTTGALLNLTITLQNGSHVTFDVDFGDTTKVVKPHPNLLAKSNPFVLGHIYTAVGNYTPTIKASNEIRVRNTVSQTITVQDRIHNLTIELAKNSVLWPTGKVDYTISLGQNQVGLTDVHCDMYHGDGGYEHIYRSQVTPLLPISHSYNYQRGAYGLRNATVNCTNLVSHVTLKQSVEVIFDEVLLDSVWANRTVLHTNKTHFIVNIKRFGTHSCIVLDFADSSQKAMYGVSGCSAGASQKGYQFNLIQHGEMVINHTYVYPDLGVYVAKIFAYNHVSNDSLSVKTIVLDWPCEFPNITYFPESSVYSPVTFMRSLPLTIQPKYIIDCMKTSIYHTNWTMYRLTGDQAILHESVKIPQLPSINLPGRTFPYGSFRLDYNISMYKVAGVFSIESVFITVEKTPLEAAIKGGNKETIGWGRSIEINAVDMTFDLDVEPLDKTGLVFKWYCRREKETLPTGSLSDVVPVLPPGKTSEDIDKGFDNGGCFFRGPGRMQYDTGKFILDTNEMLLNVTYYIRVVVTKDTRRAVAEKVLMVLPGDPPVMGFR